MRRPSDANRFGRDDFVEAQGVLCCAGSCQQRKPGDGLALLVRRNRHRSPETHDGARRVPDRKNAAARSASGRAESAAGESTSTNVARRAGGLQRSLERRQLP
jgi:hypothetical protein